MGSIGLVSGFNWVSEWVQLGQLAGSIGLESGFNWVSEWVRLG